MRARIVFDWLVLSPRGRRLRRWSFLVTIPLAILSAMVVGLGTSAAVLAARMLLWLGVVALAWRLGGERGEAVRDLLMHPRARRFARTELRVMTAPARLLRRRAGEFGYSRGAEGAPIFLALLPVALAEAGAVHLLMPAEWLWAHVGAAVLHLYGLAWLFGWAFGPRLRPHRVAGGVLHLHGGLFYGARVPLGSVRCVELRRMGTGDRGFEVQGEAALLPSRRRVDLWIELSEPVALTRPLGEPVLVRRIGLAADDPHGLAAALRSQPAAAAPARASALGNVIAGVPELAYGQA